MAIQPRAILKTQQNIGEKLRNEDRETTTKQKSGNKKKYKPVEIRLLIVNKLGFDQMTDIFVQLKIVTEDQARSLCSGEITLDKMWDRFFACINL